MICIRHVTVLTWRRQTDAGRMAIVGRIVAEVWLRSEWFTPFELMSQLFNPVIENLALCIMAFLKPAIKHWKLRRWYHGIVSFEWISKITDLNLWRICHRLVLLGAGLLWNLHKLSKALRRLASALVAARDGFVHSMHRVMRGTRHGSPLQVAGNCLLIWKILKTLFLVRYLKILHKFFGHQVLLNGHFFERFRWLTWHLRF